MSIRDTLERVRVSADFTDADGRRLAGSYSTRIDSRLTSTEGDDTIIPAGIVPSACGHLSTDDRRRSLDIKVPATDDPEIREDGWRVIITVVFCGRRGSETYVLEDIPAGSEINLADVVPIVFPEGGQVPTSPVIIHGVGIEDITYDAEASALVFHLTDGTTTEVELPGASQPGEPGGRGIESITAEGTTATVTYTDGGTDTFELPRGLQGEPGRDGVDGSDGAPGSDGVDGRGIEGITAADTTATVTYTDGGTGTFELPRGPQGEPGSDGSDGAPGSDGVDGRGIAGITSAGTTATVAYTDGGTGTFELPRGPQGEPGRDGVDGAPGEPGRDGSDGAPGSDGVDGRGIESITAEDTTATVSYTDGGTGTFELPRGPQGEQGEPGRDGADATPMDTGWEDVAPVAPFGGSLPVTGGSIPQIRRLGNEVRLRFLDTVIQHDGDRVAFGGWTLEGFLPDKEGVRFLSIDGVVTEVRIRSIHSDVTWLQWYAGEDGKTSITVNGEITWTV